MSANSPDQQGLELDLPATHAAGRMARRVAHEYAATRGLQGEVLDQLVFMLGELIDNAVDHGGGGAARDVSELEGDVRVLLNVRVLGLAAWEVSVEDESDLSPLELSKLMGGDADMPGLDDDRGRGLLLLRGFADSIDVSAGTHGKGLRVTVRVGVGPEDSAPPTP